MDGLKYRVRCTMQSEIVEESATTRWCWSSAACNYGALQTHVRISTWEKFSHVGRFHPLMHTIICARYSRTYGRNAPRFFSRDPARPCHSTYPVARFGPQTETPVPSIIEVASLHLPSITSRWFRTRWQRPIVPSPPVHTCTMSCDIASVLPSSLFSVVARITERCLYHTALCASHAETYLFE